MSSMRLSSPVTYVPLNEERIIVTDLHIWNIICTFVEDKEITMEYTDKEIENIKRHSFDKGVIIGVKFMLVLIGIFFILISL
jgi:hypothetical protein